MEIYPNSKLWLKMWLSQALDKPLVDLVRTFDSCVWILEKQHLEIEDWIVDDTWLPHASGIQSW